MANTYVDYVGSDGTGTGANAGKEFLFTFPYIKTSHVVVEINKGPAGGLNKWEPTTAFTVETSPSTRVVLDSVPNSLWRIRVLRDSDASTGIVDFENGSVLTETELDNSYTHNRYLAEEAEEGITGGSLVKNTDGQFDADGLRLENLADPDSDDDAVNKGYADNRYVDVAGDTMTGPLTLSADPINNLHAATKQYVDNNFVDETGDTMTGPLTLPDSDPTDGNHAARKSYVDSQILATLATGVAGGPIDTVNIADGAVTTDKIEDDAVTADKLDDTGVVAGSYTNTDLTVDAQGRITAASNGTLPATDLGNTPAASNVLITSSTGADTTVPSATTTLAGVMSGADKTKLDGIATGATANAGTVTSVATGAGLTGGPITTTGTIALANTVPAGAVDFNPGSDFVFPSYTDAQRTTQGFPTDGGVLAKSRPDSATDDGNIWFMCNRSDNTSYGRVNVANTSPNAKGAIFQAVVFRPTAAALAGTPSNTSESEFYVSASCQVQTLHANFTNYNPRLALTFQNYVTGGVSNIFINASAVYGGTAAATRLNLGQAGNLWNEVFAANGTINTSDERLKQDIEDLSEAETRVAIAAKGLLKKFRWKDAVQQKGENARIHFGIIAQDLIAAFETEGLDPFKYSVICFNEWWRNPEDPTDCRDEEVEGWEYGSQYAIRYDELLAFIIAAM